MSLRDAILSSGQDLAVEVNQRALIDKVLARYSGEFTVYRELLQNANDAKATTVEIHFKSAHSANDLDLASNLVQTIIVRNDGQVFNEADWTRLRKIAEGNPDEEKLGQFGVGFYSLFSLCEEPMVSSGNQVMLFHWKGSDQLYVRVAPYADTSKAPSGSSWTTFEINLREQQPMPEPEAFCRFMASSLAFTHFLTNIRVYFDDKCICSLQKKQDLSNSIRPNTALQLGSQPKKMFTLKSIDLSPVQMDAKIMAACLPEIKPKSKLLNVSNATRLLSSVFGSSPSSAPTPEPRRDPSAVIEASLFLRTVTTRLAVSLSYKDASEIERATKKPPPKHTTLQMLYSTLGEYKASHDGESDQSPSQRIFADLTGSLDKQGRIAIGFFTHQQTGCAASLEARFIPTVERESLDFVNAHVADYNKELIWMSGLVARIIYEEEVRLMARGDIDRSNPGSSIEEFVHLAKFFTYRDSTPSPVVGTLSRKAFFSSATNRDIIIRSTQGLLPASKVRLPSAELFFLKGIATLPDQVMQCDGFVTALREYKLITEIDMNDILRELASNALSEEDMQKALTWWIDLSSNRSYQSSVRDRFLNAAMLSYKPPALKDQEATETIIPLNSIRYFINQRSILPPGILPLDCLPSTVAKSFRPADLNRVFGWSEMTTAQELKHLLSPQMTVNASASIETNILQSPHFADRVLQNLSRVWSNISALWQAEICTLLAENPVIPTRQGLRKAKESYFSNVDLFPDLPIVTLPSNTPIKGNLERMLEQAGVLRHVDLQMVFSRLFAKGEKSYYDVLKYLVSVQSTLKPDEMDKLRSTAWLPAEDLADKTKYKASQLHEPSSAFRQLGLRILRLENGMRWSPHSPESRFLSTIGLRRYPKAATVLELASSTNGNVQQRETALQYFLANHDARYAEWSITELGSMPFVPCLGPTGDILCAPTQCFSNPLAALLGFPVLKPQLQAEASKFKLKRDPPPSMLLQKVISSPPARPEDATAIFGYLSTRVLDFSKADWNTLRVAGIVPLIKKKEDGSTQLTYVAPSSCYFAKQQSTKVFSGIFNFIDFGPSAKPFLSACGVTEEPTTLEVAQMLLANPARILQLAGSFDAYIDILRPIAAAHKSFPAATVQQMYKIAFFPAIIRSTAQPKKLEAEEDDATEELWTLRVANQCVVVDDVVLARLFGHHVHSIPQEDILEAFAETLGSRRLSHVVKETQQAFTPQPPSQRVEELRSLVLERSTLFLHEREGNKKEVVRSTDWLKKHLKVVEVVRLEQQYILQMGNTKRITVPVTAAAILQQGNLLLYVVMTDLDYFEVAASLCKYILAKQRVNDSLFFLTILTTPLKTLQRRGFDTTRILRARDTERQRLEQEQSTRDAEVQKQIEAVSREQATSGAMLNQLQEMFPGVSQDSLRSVLANLKQPSLEQAVQQVLDQQPEQQQMVKAEKPQSPSLPGGFPSAPPSSGFLNNWKRKLGYKGALTGEGEQAPLLPQPPPSEPSPIAAAPQLPTPGIRQTLGPNDQSSATPLDDIKRNVLQAIQASKPDQANSIMSQSQVRQVKESEESYCDSSAGANLIYVADISRLRFFVSRDVQDVEALLMQHGDALRRFAELVIHPVGKIFSMDPKALHLFYDMQGPLIAFNRNGSIFVNLRFYLAWHDEQVQAGHLEDALISNFFTCSHELAHNLVPTHDAKHEFYTSSICEFHFTKLASYLASLKR